MTLKYFAFLSLWVCFAAGGACTVLAHFISPRGAFSFKPFFSRGRSQFSPLGWKFRNAAFWLSYLGGACVVAWYFL
jgi:hypothetical protein